MSQAWLPVLILSSALLCGTAGAAYREFTSAESEAAREGLILALEDAVAAVAAKSDEIDLPPSISESVRRVAFVTVDTVKDAKNITFHGLASLHRDGPAGVDPIAAGREVAFTLPLGLDSPYMTGDLVRKVNNVGPTGHFNTTFGSFRFEAEGTATVASSTCSFNVIAIRNVELSGVDTTVEGASVLNRVLAKEMSDGVRSGAVSVKDPVTRNVLQRLQEQASLQDCTAKVRERLAKVPALAASPAA